MTGDNSRPTLPGDAEGRSWAIGRPEGGSDVPEKRVIATLLAADDDLNLRILGAAFVIVANGSTAICMCAAHSLETVKMFEGMRKPRSAWSVPPDLAVSVTEYIDSSRVKAVLIIDDKAITCDVVQINYLAENDIAIISIVSPDGEDIFHEKLALDFAIPRIGAEVVVMSNQMERIPPDSREGRINLDFQMRRGIVTDINLGNIMRGQSAIFYTSIPVPGGMSGSPVLIRPAPGAPLVVCGVVSSDFSPPGSEGTFLASGRSAMSILYPSLGLGVTITRAEVGAPEHSSLAGLIEVGLVANHTSNASFRIKQSKQETIIEYEDPIQGRIQLRSPGHPLAPD